MSTKKKLEKAEILNPAAAAAAAFDEVQDLACVNLTTGTRVEDSMSTGTLCGDLILGSGYAPGFGTIFGPEGSGKSTLATMHIVAAQQLGIPVVVYDPEAGSDPVYMRTQGVNFDYKITTQDTLEQVVKGKKTKKKVEVEHPGLFFVQPDTGEAIYRHILRTLRHMPLVDEGPPSILFLIDSIEGMASEEVDEVGDGGRIADEARMHSYFLKRVVPKLRRRRALIIGTNQMRTNIGAYGAPLKEAGGKALAFWPAYKIRTSTKKLEDDKIGIKTLPLIWRTVKNKFFPPFRSTDARINLGRGIDKGYDAFYFLNHLGLLERKAGKQRILLEGHGKILDWRSFRRTVEAPAFRELCFDMLRQNETYELYHEHSQETNYFYDAEYDDAEKQETVIDEELKAALDDEAAEYEENVKTRRKKGKKPSGKSKKHDHDDLDLDNEDF